MSTVSEQMENQKRLVWRFIEEGFNNNAPTVAYEVCHPRYRNDGSVVAVPDGPKGMATHIDNAHAQSGQFRLNIVDILAEGDTASVLWQTWGSTGKYLANVTSSNDTSAWLIGHCGFEDGLIRQHVINWEPMRLMAQSGALVTNSNGRSVADLAQMSLSSLRYKAFSTYTTEVEATPARIASLTERSMIADQAQTTLNYLYGADDVAPEVARDAYLSFADMPDQRGIAGLATRRRLLRGAFSEADVKIEMLVVEQGRVTLRWTFTAIHSGDWLGLPATGRPLSATGSAYARIEQGKISIWIEVLDILRLIRQLGGLAAVMPGCFPDQ